MTPEARTVTWRLAHLLPLWILQFLVFILVITYLGLVLGSDRGTGVVLGELVFFVVCIILVGAEVVARACRRVNVWLFFTCQLFKAFFWTVILALTVLNLVVVMSDSAYMAAGVIIIVVYLVVTSLIVYGTLAYSCVQVHRHRKSRSEGASLPKN